MTNSRRADVFALLALTSLITLFFADVLAGWSSLYTRDVAHYYYPLKHVLREIVLGGEFPYWNPLLSAGQPMAANPEHEVFYPLTWLILLPSYELGFRLLVLSHLYIAGWTMYALLRSMRSTPPAAFFGALSFSMGGIVLSCLTLLPILFIAAWLPLTCLFTRRFLLDRRPRDFVMASLSLGLQVLIGEPTTLIQAGLLLGLYALHIGIRRRSLRATTQAIGAVTLITLAAIALAAVMVLPAIDHLRDSVRADGLPFDTVTLWSMPFVRVVEMVFPNVLGRIAFGEEHLYWGRTLYPGRNTPFFPSIYAGLSVAVLVLAGLFARSRGALLTGITAAFSLLVATGAATPLWAVLYDLDIVRSIRYPEKFILLGVFALTLFAARTLDAVLGGNERLRRIALGTAVAVASVAAVASIVAVSPWHAPAFRALWKPGVGQLESMLAASRSGWLVALLSAALVVILIRALPRVRRAVWLLAASCFVILDLALLLPGLAPRMPSSYLTGVPKMASALPAERDSWRLMHLVQWQALDPVYRAYHPGGTREYWLRRNALYPMMTSRWGIRTVMEVDYDLTVLRPTADFVESGMKLVGAREDWPAILAPMTNSRFLGVFPPPQEGLAHAGPDWRNVEAIRLVPLGENPRYYLAERLEEIRSVGDFRQRLNHGTFPRRTAFVAGPVFAPAAGTVGSVRENANSARIEVETSGRSFLVISVTPHQHWRITINGAEAESLVTNVGFQGVVLPAAGRHIVEMRYRNPWIAIGAALSGATLLVLLLLALRAGPPAAVASRPTLAEPERSRQG